MRRHGEHTPMLREYLRPENIVTDLAGSADEIFNKLISLNTTADEQLKLRAAFDGDALARFSYAGDGVLIPHARVTGLTRVITVLAISKAGISHSTGQIHLILLLAVPEERTALHLQLLQGVSSILPAIAPEAKNLTEPKPILELIARGEEHAKPSYRNLTQQQIEFELHTNAEQGLSTSEAMRRLNDYGGNVVRHGFRVPWYIKLLKNFFSFFAVLLWIAALLCFVPGVDMPQLGIAILIVVTVNGIFSFLQEYKSDRAVEALKKLMARTSRVVRDGAVGEIDAENLVPGDVILLEEGDIVPADSRLVEAFEVEVDNSSLTGESTSAKRYKSDKPVLLEGKFLWMELPNILFAGSTLIKGNARAVVFATGMATEIGKIANLTLNIKSEPSPLQKQLRTTVFAISMLALTIGLTFLFLGWLVAGLSFVQAFVFFIGIFVANVPEGLLPTVTLSLAMGVTRMAKRNAIVKNLSSVETLGCTTVIGTDKTGTLTQNLMMVNEIIAGGEKIRIEGHGYETDGHFLRDGKEIAVHDLAQNASLRALIDCALICNNARLEKTLSGTRVIGDPTEGCLQTLAARARVSGTNQRLHLNPFESVRKRMSVIIIEPRTGKRIAYAKGAPVEMLACCTHHLLDGKRTELTEADRNAIRAEIDAFAAQGYRVLGFGMRDDEVLQKEAEYTVENTENQLVFLGLTAISDPVRPGVPDAIKACHTAGIRIMMITGDYPLTAKSIAKQIGIGGGGEIAVRSGTDLSAMSDADLKDLLRNGETVFARVSPEQKLRIVTQLKELGEIVAVTGDGVNDGPALKKADIGIAMGLRGTDVAKEAAQIILTDDNFGSIVAAIEEGRGIFDNIRKFAAYVLNSNPQELYPFILWMLIPGFPLVMTVMGVLAVDVGTDLIPAMGLGIEPPEKGIMERPPRKKGERLLSMGFILRSYLVQGSILALSCFATYYYFAWAMGYLTGPNWYMNLPLSPAKLDMTQASSVYLQSLTAFFFPTVAVQIANVLSKRSSRSSLFSRDFLQENTRVSKIAAMRSYRPQLRTVKVKIHYEVTSLRRSEAPRALVSQLWHLVAFLPRTFFMHLANLTVHLRRIIGVPFVHAMAGFFERHPIVFNFFSNPLINIGIVFELVLCYAFFYTDLSKVYFFSPVPWHVYVFAFHGLVLMLVFEETKKYFRRRGNALEFLG